ncbi:MAG: PorP/SprF family type IX secretion system membrane protein, partial [Bacteroidota bacterium]
MKRIVTLIAFVQFAYFGWAQQAQLAPQYSMYMLNRYAFNPAYAGLDNSLSITGVYRKQWAGLEGSPTTQNINMHLPLYYLRGGFGIGLENESLGAEQNTTASVSYNYWLPVNKTSLLSIGVGAGIVQKSIDGTKLRAPDGVYEPGAFNHNDDFIPLTKETAQAPTVNVGVYFQSPKFDVGLSANNLLGSSFAIEANETVNIGLVQNYFFIFAGAFDIGQNLVLHPSVFAKSDTRQTQAEISAILKYNG